MSRRCPQKEEFDVILPIWLNISGLQKAAAGGMLVSVNAMLSYMIEKFGQDFAREKFNTYPSASVCKTSPLLLISRSVSSMLRRKEARLSVPHYMCFLSLWLWFGRQRLAMEMSGQAVLNNKSADEQFLAQASEEEKKQIKECKAACEKVDTHFNTIKSTLFKLQEKGGVTRFHVEELFDLTERFSKLSEEERFGVKSRAVEEDLIGFVLERYRTQLKVGGGMAMYNSEKIARALYVLIRSFGFSTYGKVAGREIDYEATASYNSAYKVGEVSYTQIALEECERAQALERVGIRRRIP